MAISYKDIMKIAIPFSFTGFQTLSQNNYATCRDSFLGKGVTEGEFSQIIQLVDAIPGATNVQLIVALGTVAKKSALGGIVALLCASAPGAVILLILGLYYADYSDPHDLNVIVLLAIQGLKSATAALILHLCFSLTLQHLNTKLNILISLISGVAVYFFQSPMNMVLIMGMGGMIQLMVEYDQENTTGRRTFVHQEAKPAPVPQELVISVHNYQQVSSYLGKKSLHIYLLVLFVLLYLNAYYKEYTNIIEITLSFYKIGSIMIGGAPIMVPFIYSETEKNSLNITSDAFWISFGLAASLPGPYLNFAIFLGATSFGIIGGICCWVASFLPSVLQIWGLLPLWNTLGTNQYFTKLKQGVTSSAIGFVYISAYHCWKEASLVDAETATIITILSLLYLLLLNFKTPLVILCGSILFIVRYLALWYYRELHPVILK